MTVVVHRTIKYNTDNLKLYFPATLAMIMTKPTLQLEWNDSMSVGIQEIDTDHKQFILLINELNRFVAAGLKQDEIKKQLQFIVYVSARHFLQEEKLLSKWRYPDTDRHKFAHTQVLKELQKIQDECIPSGLDSEWAGIGHRIESTLITHILTEDMKYANFNNSRNVSADE
jgi:hemerythrin-like metal-binding protein